MTMPRPTTSEEIGAIIGAVNISNALKLHIQQLNHLGLLEQGESEKMLGVLADQRETIVMAILPLVTDTPWLADFLSGMLNAQNFNQLRPNAKQQPPAELSPDITRN